MNRQEQRDQTNSLEKTIKKIDNQIQLPDLLHILYLKPFQCVLDQVKDALPRGLKFVQRKNETQYQIKPFKDILKFQQFNKLSRSQKDKLIQNQQKSNISGLRQQQPKQVFPTYLTYLKQNHGDNLLSQMKSQGNIQIAICICMYNEDKGMLSNTLLGVGQNIMNLYRQGVDPDKVAVIVVQDGIQKMDSSILQLFQVLERESGMRFSVNKQKDIDQYLNRISHFQTLRSKFGWSGQDSILNLNNFLFSKSQEQERQKLRFINVKKEYDQINNLLKQVINLKKKKNVTHEDLPPKILEFFKLQCKKSRIGDLQDDLLQYAQHLNKTQRQEKQKQSLEKYYKQVISEDLNSIKPLVQNALTKAQYFCKQYINSRLQMSHVSFFRTGQFIPQFSIKEQDRINEKVSQTINNHPIIKNYIKNNSEPKDDEIQKEIINKQKYLKELFSIKMNLFFVIKYRNAQKLSSHNWFFNGFCKQFSKLQRPSVDPSPKYTILLDVGLRPQGTALCKMYNSMQNHEDIGGVCGYMGLKLQKQDASANQLYQKLDFFTNLFLNFVNIQRAQQLQYNFAHLIDKGFQSIFGFIHVLPGAFSGYNMKAIWGDSAPKKDTQLLKKYFKSIGDKVKDQKYDQDNLSCLGIIFRVLLPNLILKILPFTSVSKKSHEYLMYESNVYLAEDRILCMGIHNHHFKLRFIPDAYSFVDPVKDLPALMGQRKRWINGSYFAFQKVSQQFSEQKECKIAITFQIWYLSFMNILAYIAPGFFLFSISVAMEAFKADILVKFFEQSIPKQSQIYNAFVYTINFIYALIIFGLIFFSMSLTNRNDKFIRFVYGVSTVLGIMSIIMLVILTVDLIRGLGRGNSYLIQNQNPTFISQIPGGQSTIDIIRYIVLGIMGLYAVPLLIYSLMFFNAKIIFEVLAGAISFAFYNPTYLIILNIYALCRMDDLSWGTKGLDAGSGKDQQIQKNWKVIKTIHVAKLVFWNVLVAGILIHLGSNYLVRFWLTLSLMILIAGTMLIKVSFALIYYIYYKTCIKSDPKRVGTRNNEYQQIRIPILVQQFEFDKDNLQSNLEKQIREEIRNNIKKLQKQSGLENSQTNTTNLQIFNNLQANGNNNKLNQSLMAGVSGVQKKTSSMFKSKALLLKKTAQNLAPLTKNTQNKNQYKPIKTQNQQQLSQNEGQLSPQKHKLLNNQSKLLSNQSVSIQQNSSNGFINLLPPGATKVKKTALDFKNPGMNIKKK